MIAEIWLLFLTGLLGSLHCVGMCGGFVSALSLTSSATNQFRSHVVFNSGRILSYAFMGGLIGWTGKVVGSLRFWQPIRGVFHILVGVVMLILALELMGWFRIFRTESKLFQCGLAQSTRSISFLRRFVIGSFMGLVPCGLTYAVYVKCLTAGSFAEGAVMALAFALGTVPAMLGVGSLTGIGTGKTRRLFVNISGGIIAVLAVFSILSGVKNLQTSPTACVHHSPHLKGAEVALRSLSH